MQTVRDLARDLGCKPKIVDVLRADCEDSLLRDMRISEFYDFVGIAYDTPPRNRTALQRRAIKMASTPKLMEKFDA